jgi:hypothetical protein
VNHSLKSALQPALKLTPKLAAKTFSEEGAQSAFIKL